MSSQDVSAEEGNKISNLQECSGWGPKEPEKNGEGKFLYHVSMDKGDFKASFHFVSRFFL